jgi:ribosome modulation factor
MTMKTLTRKETFRQEQDKNLAFRQGITAFIQGKALEANPHQNTPERAHQEAAWNRGWKSEESIRGMNSRLKENHQ